MKPKETKKDGNGKNAKNEIESVIKLLKKKELQTKILKKIMPENKPSENKPV
jgi:hypothetical protein